MATLKNARGLTIVVPDGAVPSYLEQGFKHLAPDVPTSAPVTRPRAKRAPSKKGAAHAVLPRTDGVPRSPKGDPEPVQPSE